MHNMRSRDVGERLYLVQHHGGQKEGSEGKRGGREQKDIHSPMNALTTPAVRAGSEVGFVVAAEFRRDAGDVIAPSGKDCAHHLVVAGVQTRHAGTKWGDRHRHTSFYSLFRIFFTRFLITFLYRKIHSTGKIIAREQECRR